jgi:putative intracellular protease/amidase
VRVLLPLPDRDFDVTEVAVPWSILRDAGHQVVFATEKPATVPAADPRLLTGVLFGQLGAAPEARKRYYELVKAPEFGATVGWAELDPDGFDGLIAPVTGRSVLADRRTTCLPKYMERSAYLPGWLAPGGSAATTALTRRTSRTKCGPPWTTRAASSSAGR